MKNRKCQFGDAQNKYPTHDIHEPFWRPAIAHFGSADHHHKQYDHHNCWGPIYPCQIPLYMQGPLVGQLTDSFESIEINQQEQKGKKDRKDNISHGLKVASLLADRLNILIL